MSSTFPATADKAVLDDDEYGPSDDLGLQFEAASRLAPHEKDLVREVVESIIIRHDANLWLRARRPADAGPLSLLVLYSFWQGSECDFFRCEI